MLRHARLPALLLALVACSSSTSPGSGSTCTPSATLACVTIRDFSFSPATISIKAGTTVQWTNAGPSAHTTVSDGGLWTSPTLNSPVAGGTYGGGGPGGTFQFTFNNQGVFTYHCALHPPSIPQYAAFTGTITVTP